MTEKRFTLKQGFNDELDYGHFLLDNGMKLTTNEVVELLNMLHEENEQLKTMIREAYNNERTQIGRNVLKQLIEQME